MQKINKQGKEPQKSFEFDKHKHNPFLDFLPTFQKGKGRLRLRDEHKVLTCSHPIQAKKPELILHLHLLSRGQMNENCQGGLVA